ncbi:MAG: bifunctional glutamate N-acetyltransferase/amino-acid acetyltransferase ArgJ [Phycisphaerae bacterium]|nr:bifunctional glutamate N-acetyltransferase/amino-acid acetyltransferase ArgJ [Phycisphaerae bacterium]
MTRHITLPAGFSAAGVECGIKPSGKKDMAIIAADRDCSVAVVTTSNQITGAPIQWIRSILPRGAGKARGMVINAGNSNVCTGKAGLADAKAMAVLTAKQLGTTPEKILVASTGVIGHRLPMPNIRRGIVAAAKSLARRNDSAVVQAIMTTDLREKSAVVQTTIGGKTVTVAGIVKGSGMIAPSLATMIGVITTDAKISPVLLKKALVGAVKPTFNAVTVDTDESTSDIVAVFASGAVGGKSIAADSSEYRKFAAAVLEVCEALARGIAADGEGATRLVEINVSGARNDGEAEIAAKSVANSPLVKTAIHGADPNWGRIAMALGKSSAKVVAEKLTISICGVKIFARGTGCKFSPAKVSKLLTADTVAIDCSLGLGKGKFTALTCDLSREYITINADYTT